MTRAVMVMFDSLNRLWLPPYAADAATTLVNFERLGRQAVTFDRSYAGSLPCMPARRELHTGRYNFLHRSWGPLEPFDDSMPEMLKASGVHTHLATDHFHYWEDGGATFHNRYSTYELVRGQQGDPWKAAVQPGPLPAAVEVRRDLRWRQDVINRAHTRTLATHPQTLTFDAGLEFLVDNHEADGWFLQIETFDPHEPFFVPREASTTSDQAIRFDWPDNKRVIETAAEVDVMRRNYSDLLAMCDHSLGRVLDAFDELELWDDTLLIVCTDHGFLLGEHDWFGKNAAPWYEENAHTPLFIWDPRSGVRGERRGSLVQLIDLAPTLLEHFGIAPTELMEGQPLQPVIAEDRRVRAGALFGHFGGHVNVTDGRYVYMRACWDASNRPLSDHTLMPMRMTSLIPPAAFCDVELTSPQGWAKGARVFSMPPLTMGNPYGTGTMLFDLAVDPTQMVLIDDPTIEIQMAQLLVDLMRANDAPLEQFERLGLPVAGDVERRHLLVADQWATAVRATQPLPRSSSFDARRCGVVTPLRELSTVAGALDLVAEALATSFAGPELIKLGEATPLQLAAFAVGVSPDDIQRLDRGLAALAGQLVDVVADPRSGRG